MPICAPYVRCVNVLRKLLPTLHQRQHAYQPHVWLELHQNVGLEKPAIIIVVTIFVLRRKRLPPDRLCSHIYFNTFCLKWLGFAVSTSLYQAHLLTYPPSRIIGRGCTIYLCKGSNCVGDMHLGDSLQQFRINIQHKRGRGKVVIQQERTSTITKVNGGRELVQKFAPCDDSKPKIPFISCAPTSVSLWINVFLSCSGTFAPTRNGLVGCPEVSNKAQEDETTHLRAIA